MEPSAFLALVMSCAPQVHADTARAIVQVESGFNPWAIGVVGGYLIRQPRSRGEALATARGLQDRGWDYSVGLGQINARNFSRFGLTLETALEPCTNLSAMQAVLTDCFARAKAGNPGPDQVQLRKALSCYYSGDFSTGMQHGYVLRVIGAATPKRLTSPTPSKEQP